MFLIRQTISIVLLLGLCSFSSAIFANPKLTISFTLPKLAVSPYHRPYVVVWLEAPSRKYISTLALWADDVQWHKDLRQWWRRVGRQAPDYDAVTSATRKPGPYNLTWQGELPDGTSLPSGEYLVNVEVSREEGGRSYFRQAFSWDGNAAEFNLADKGELHDLTIQISSN